jgi:hypothetical protein
MRYELVPIKGKSDLPVLDREFEFEGEAHGMIVRLPFSLVFATASPFPCKVESRYFGMSID